MALFNTSNKDPFSRLIFRLKYFIAISYWLITGKYLLKVPSGLLPVPSGIYPGVLLDRFLNRGKLSLAQQGEDLILDRIISRVLYKSLWEKGFYIDIGAFNAIDDSVTYSLYKRGWNGIAVDPSLRTKKSFKKFRKRDIFKRCVISKVEKEEVDFYINRNAIEDSHTGNTLYPTEFKRNDLNKYKKVQIESRTLGSILEEHNIKNIDVLNVDVEGGDLDVLLSFDIKKYTPKIICVEIFVAGLKDLDDNEIHILLVKNGYHLYASSVITQFYVYSEAIPEKYFNELTT